MFPQLGLQVQAACDGNQKLADITSSGDGSDQSHAAMQNLPWMQQLGSTEAGFGDLYGMLQDHARLTAAHLRKRGADVPGSFRFGTSDVQLMDMAALSGKACSAGIDVHLQQESLLRPAGIHLIANIAGWQLLSQYALPAREKRSLSVAFVALLRAISMVPESAAPVVLGGCSKPDAYRLIRQAMQQVGQAGGPERWGTQHTAATACTPCEGGFPE